MKEIATRSGVSQATVSYALKGTGRIASATRERIRNLAAEMGYTEDPLLGALAAYRKTLPVSKPAGTRIAVLMPDDQKQPWQTAHDQVRLLDGIKAGAKEWGFGLDLFEHDGTAEACRQLTRIISSRGIRGVILSFPRPWELDQPRDLDWSRFATVACKPIFARNIFHSISTDHFGNGRILYRRLYQLGYRRIGLFFSRDLDRISNRAFKAGLWTEQDLLASPENCLSPVVVDNWDANEFRKWYYRWLPDAVVSQRWIVRSWLRDLGQKNPKDVGLAVPSTDKLEFDAGIDQNHARMGQEAVRLLRDQLILGQYGIPQVALQINIPATWHMGGSLRDLNPVDVSQG